MSDNTLPVIEGLAGLIDPDTVVERLWTGAIWSEGPVWIPDLRAVRWSDIHNNRILQFHADDGSTVVYSDNAEFTNGRTLDRQGRVIQCSHGRRRVERDHDDEITAIVETWNGVQFNSPNDVVVARDGAIWFTDPAYGISIAVEGHPGEREYRDQYVFCHDETTGITRPVILDVEAPNGLAFSPDESILYVADSSGSGSGIHPGVGNRHIRAYDLIDGRCKNGRTVITIEDGVPDGLRVDTDGNIWTSTKYGVGVYDPTGRELGVIRLPETTANLCFGGPDGTDVYITASSSLYRVRTRARDAATA
ncbi:SMP-30/gluconolactonase/LRE family protein [Microlunatus speluncae]|uniref:SMP-30/gluconolactonase/LRE family protein n=1 Tax=Microlunatus speluncae TaxID=2594267 RepID=UPI0012660766|nr:SMP-30/gluconolactonase/LRE family protein [Microlunatus speluncae]